MLAAPPFLCRCCYASRVGAHMVMVVVMVVVVAAGCLVLLGHARIPTLLRTSLQKICQCSHLHEYQCRNSSSLNLLPAWGMLH
eukprot:1159685-Pelagomonas_calceolata.AAC.3